MGVFSRLISSQTAATIEAFRDWKYTKAYVKNHAAQFLDTDWVDPAEFTKWLDDEDGVRPGYRSVRSSPPPRSRASLSPPGPSRRLKRAASEPDMFADFERAAASSSFKRRASSPIEISSDSEDEDLPARAPCRKKLFKKEPSAKRVKVEATEEALPVTAAAAVTAAAVAAADADIINYVFTLPEPTMLPDMTLGYKVTAQLSVKHVKVLTSIPVCWEVPREPTAYILNLSRDSSLPAKKTIDALIKDKDSDSWGGTTGAGDSKPKVMLLSDPVTGAAVECRRSRLTCMGSWHCEAVEPSLLANYERYAPGDGQREAALRVQQAALLREGQSTKHAALSFFNTIAGSEWHCPVKDQAGQFCTGTPHMIPMRTPSNGRNYFVGCTRWTPAERGHRTVNIPSNVQEHDLSILLRGGNIGAVAEESCGRIVSPRVGAKLKQCNLAHTRDGQALAAQMVHLKCGASRKIFVPVDARLRIVVVVPDTEPHNHPQFPEDKMHYEVRQAYDDMVDAAGLLGNTVLGIDNAPTTLLKTGGRPLAQAVPALGNSRRKRDHLRKRKTESFPAGLGIGGVHDLFNADKNLPPHERYIHKIATTPSNGTVIITFNVYLASFIHDAPRIMVDTTFKRVSGEFNEWEVVMFVPHAQRRVSIGRVYTNRADREHYGVLWREFFAAVEMMTGRPLKFKRLQRDGTLLAVIVDQEAAQVQALGDVLLGFNEPEFSKITTCDADEIVQYILKCCHVHCDRGLYPLKGLVTADEFAILRSVMHMRTEQEFNTFTAFCTTTKVKKIRDWHAHKVSYRWILVTTRAVLRFSPPF